MERRTKNMGQRDYVCCEITFFFFQASIAFEILIMFSKYCNLLTRRRSRSGTPRRRRSRSPTLRRRKSRSPTPRRHKRQRSRSTSLSPPPKSRSPSVVSTERKNAIEKLRKEEEEKKRYLHLFLKIWRIYCWISSAFTTFVPEKKVGSCKLYLKLWSVWRWRIFSVDSYWSRTIVCYIQLIFIPEHEACFIWTYLWLMQSLLH